MEGEAKGAADVLSSPRGSGLAEAGWAAAATAALLALLDIAIETWWSGSPTRWWIAPPALALVVASVWLWWPTAEAAKRWGWAGAASWSVGCLLLLLAASAWLPDGLTAGVRMLRQPTSTVLTTVTAAAVLLAARVLFRALGVLPSTPRLATRAVVAAMAFYAVASLGLALYDRTPFATLFQGGAAWQRLPRWLQGAFIGAFAVLPLAILGQAIRVIAFVRRQEPIRVLLHQATALVMALVMAVSGLTVPVTVAPPAGGSRDGSATEGTSAASRGTVPAAEPGRGPGAASGGDAAAAWAAGRSDAAPVPLDQLRAEWTAGQDPVAFAERVLAAAESEVRKPGADPSDIDAKAAALGRDPQKIFAFLRDQIALEPYVGMLRDARGTLAAAAGNALDRALLAQALLKAGRIESRLVSGTLSDEQAQQLLDRLLASQPLAGPLADATASGVGVTAEAAAQETAARVGLPAGRAQELVQRASEQFGAFWRVADGQRRQQEAFLAGQLRDAGVAAAGNAGVSARTLRDRLRKHYWVQTRGADGVWSDFDPSFAESRVGEAYAVSPSPLSSVPRDLAHRLEFSLVYLTNAGGARKRDVVLTVTIPATEALFTPVAFELRPAGPTPDTATLAGMPPAQKVALLRKMERFQGILQVGSNVTAGRIFDFAGQTYDPGSSRAPSGQTVGNMFGSLLGDEAPATPGEFEELQIVFRLSGPGRTPATQTRTLVRAEEAKAADFAPPLMWSEILVQPSWIPSDLVVHQLLQSLVASRGLVIDAMRASREGRAAQVVPPAVPPYPQHLLPLALLRQRAAATILSSHAGVRALVDAPLLTMANQRITVVNAETGNIHVQRSIDIVSNGVSMIGPQGEANQATYEAALRLGVADSVLEASFLQQAYPEHTAVSGATIFEQAEREGRPVRVLSPSNADKLRQAGLGEPDVAWIRDNEPQVNRLVVATTTGGSAGWWSVAPGGTSLLRVSGGWGQGMTEHQFANLIKGIAMAYCGYEISHWSHHPTAATSWGMASCVVLSTISLTFILVGVHGAWVTLLLAVEILNVVGTAIAADSERTRVIDLRR